MIDNVLYIIGNGFDRHHDVESGYCNFRDWLKRNNPDLYHVYSAVCRYDALWSDFENGLAYVDRDYFINFAEGFLPDYSKDPDDWQMADILLAGDWALGAVEVIYVLGFSFNPIDMPYIRRIIECNDAPENIRWNVSHYNDEEKSKFQQILANLGIDVDSRVQFHPLSHWQIRR